MKAIIGIVIFFFSTAFFHPADIEEIPWSEARVLAYGDFKGAIPEETSWAALTSSYVYFTYGTTNGKLSSYKVYAAFRKNESWMKVKNAAVLSHEQLHFNLTEIYTRKLYQQLGDLQKESVNVPEKAKSLFQRINATCDSVQKQYDSQTAHGTLEDEQAEWKKKTDSLLKLYPPYPRQ
jgi:hypothetical protein